jgi:hypothetical protein
MTTTTKRVPSGASGGTTKRVTASAAGGSTQRVTGAITADTTKRVTTETLTDGPFLLLEGDFDGALRLEEDGAGFLKLEGSF